MPMCEATERQVGCQAEPRVGSSAPVRALWAAVREGAGKTGSEVPMAVQVYAHTWQCSSAWDKTICSTCHLAY